MKAVFKKLNFTTKTKILLACLNIDVLSIAD